MVEWDLLRTVGKQLDTGQSRVSRAHLLVGLDGDHTNEPGSEQASELAGSGSQIEHAGGWWKLSYVDDLIRRLGRPRS